METGVCRTAGIRVRREVPATTFAWNRNVVTVCKIHMKIRFIMPCVLGVGLVFGAEAAQEPPAITVVADGLNNPRGLAFAPNGALYVAEAGLGAGDGHGGFGVGVGF